jgi:hypothetical protein
MSNNERKTIGIKSTYPDPDNANPGARDTLNLGEAPVSVDGDDGGDNLGNDEGTHESEGRTLHEEEAVGTRDEDESLRDNGDLEVDDGVQLRVVGSNCTRQVSTIVEGSTELVVEEARLQDDGNKSNTMKKLAYKLKSTKGLEGLRGGGEVETVGNGEREDLGKVPCIRSHRGQDTVNGEGHDGTIVQEGNDKNHEWREVELEREGQDSETDDDTDGDGASVDRVVTHTLEDDTRTTDSMHNSGETRLSQDDIGSTTSSIGSTLDGNTDVGTGESGGIVSTITSHSTQVAETLETLDDLVLVFGVDTGETIGVHDHLVEGSVLATRGGSVLQNLGGVHVVTETETTAGFLCDSELVTGNHLDLDTESDGIVNGLFSIVTGRIEDGEETDKLEAVTLTLGILVVEFLVGDSESTETTRSVLLDVNLKAVLEFFGLVAGDELDDLASHTLGDTLKLASGLLTVGNLSTLVDGVERLEVQELDALTSTLGITKGRDDGSINGVLVLGTGSVGSEEDDILSGEGAVGLDRVAVNRQLVGGEGTSLIRAKDGDTSQLLDGSNTSDDGLVLSELLSTDSESDRQDSGHGNGDTTDQEDKDIVKTTTVAVAEASVEDEDLSDDEDTDGDQAERADLGQDLLQVTGSVVVLTDEGGSTTEEGVGAGRDNDTLSLTLLANGATEGRMSERTNR